MWWQVLFWALLVPCLIILGIVYGTGKRLYKLFSILATFTYVITVAYVIDVFHLGRNWILGLLVLSAAAMLLLGYRMTQRGEKPAKRKRPAPTMRSILLICLVLILILVAIILGSLGSPAKEVRLVEELSRSSLFPQGKGYESGVPLGNITYTNRYFLPVVAEDQYFAACWRPFDGSEFRELQVMADGEYRYPGPASQFEEVAPGKSRVVRLLLTGYPVLAFPSDRNATEELLREYAKYDGIRILASPEGQPSCFDETLRVTLDVVIPLVE